MNFSLIQKRREGDLYELSRNVTPKDIIKLSSIADIGCIQIGYPITNELVWKALESEIFKKRSNIELRIYDSMIHYDSYKERLLKPYFNFSFFQYIPSVKNLNIEVINCQNENDIANLTKLEILKFKVFLLESFNFFSSCSFQIKRLSLGKTKSKKPSLTFLSSFKSLEYFKNVGHKKNIECISKLNNLTELMIQEVPEHDINYLKSLENLVDISFWRGGTKHFKILSEIPTIKMLSLGAINKLNDIRFISEMINLEKLHLRDLPHISEVPDLKKNITLKKITLDSLKGLENIDEIKYVENLEEFNCTVTSDMEVQSFEPILRNKNLKSINVGFYGKSHTNKNIEFKKLLIKHD